MPTGIGTAISVAAPIVAKYGPAIFSSAASFNQLQKSNQNAEDAALKAEELLEDAKRKIEINRMEGLTIPTEAYEQEQEALLAATSKAIDSLTESGDVRSIIGGVGRVTAESAAAANAIRSDKEEKLFEIDKIKREEDAAIDQQLAQMDVAGAKDQQQIAADAEEGRVASMTGLVSSLGSLATTVAKDQKLFRMSPDAEQATKNAANPKYVEALEKYGFKKEDYLMDPQGTLDAISKKIDAAQGIGDAPAPPVMSVADELTPADTGYKSFMEPEADDKDVVPAGVGIRNKGDRRIPKRFDPFASQEGNRFKVKEDAIFRKTDFNESLRRFGLTPN
tara:strand:- start:9174 stop:10178 length:1005 start_codon:yes stop_codon:yes gene_type:complete